MAGGRIRTLKPEILEDSATARLSSDAFRVFVAMVVLADDHGNLRASPGWLFGQVFHGRGPTVPMDAILAELSSKLITLYEAGDQQYAHLNGWAKHQRIDNAQEPRVPLPPGWEVERIEWTSDRRKRARWVSRPAADAPPYARALPPWQTATDPHSRELPPWQTATVPYRRALPPPDRDLDRDQDLDRDREAPPPPPPPPTSPTEATILAALTSSPLVAGAEGVEGAARTLAARVAALPPEERWSDFGAEVDEWMATASKALLSARDGGQHWSADRALAEVVSKAQQRIRYRPKDARMERERNRQRATQWPDGKAKSPATLDTEDVGAEIAEADRRLAQERRQREAEPRADPAELARLAARVVGGFKRGAA